MNAEPTNAEQVRPIGIAEMRGRFGLGPRRARSLLRKMRHLREGRDLFTTEAWLAEYVAANAVQAAGPKWPDPKRDREPVDEDVVKRAVELIGALAGQGHIKVFAVN